MNTNEDFDYQSYMKENSPDVATIQRGTCNRESRRLETARRTIRIDEDILEQFQQLAPEKPEKLINQALREWLFTKDMKELVRDEFQKMLQQALFSIQTATPLPRSKMGTF
jgi:uncharacterized protein (DUF4415 family)